MPTEITFEPNLLVQDKEFLVDGLLNHLADEASLSVEQIRSKPFAFVVRKDGKLHAGLTCEIEYRSVFMDLLWVDQSLRRQRIGSSLLTKAEKYAVNQGCTIAFLHTLSPDYIKFYEHAGYALEYSRPGYLGELAMHYFRKQLV